MGQLQASNRDFHSNCWANLRILGQPCAFQVWLRGRDGQPGGFCRQPRRAAAAAGGAPVGGCYYCEPHTAEHQGRVPCPLDATHTVPLSKLNKHVKVQARAVESLRAHLHRCVLNHSYDCIHISACADGGGLLMTLRVRKMPSWPTSAFSSSLYSHRNNVVNLHRLGQPNTSLATAHGCGGVRRRAGGIGRGGREAGRGRIVALHYRSSTSSQVRSNIFGASISEATMRPDPRHEAEERQAPARAARRR